MTNLMSKNKMLKSLQSFLVLKNISFLIGNYLFFQLATVHKNTKISISKNLTSRLPIRDSLFVPFSLTVVTRTNTKTVHKLLWLIYNIFCDTPYFVFLWTVANWKKRELLMRKEKFLRTKKLGRLFSILFFAIKFVIYLSDCSLYLFA